LRCDHASQQPSFHWQRMLSPVNHVYLSRPVTRAPMQPDCSFLPGRWDARKRRWLL
jgi:hypothetical protein